MNTEQQSQTVPDKHYSTIAELPLNRYVDCLIDKDLSRLVISGNPSPDELAIAWENILQEYSDAMGDGDYELYLTLAKELALLNLQHSLVENSVKLLQMVYYVEFADEVNRVLNTKFKFDWSDQAEYQKELTRCLNRNKAIFIKHELKKAQLSGQEEKFESKGKLPTREYFISVLITLSDYAKYTIHDTITVFEFCQRVFRLNNYIKQAQKESNGK